MKFERGGLSKEELLDLYKALVRPRMIEEKMLVLLRQGRISKWFSGIGQEAISVGAAMALDHEAYMLPMHRNLGMFTSRGVPFDRLFSQWQGKLNGFSKGRERSFHFGTQDYGLVGMISHLGPQLAIADGIALAHKLKKEKQVCFVITGDGGTSEGDFHEALNVASVWDLPVIFCIESNGYGLSTPSNEQYRCAQLADRALGYGMESRVIDGNNLLEVYHTISELAASLKERPRPVLLECITFRMRGHEEASGTKYVPQELFEEWKKKDPVDNYRNWLLQEKLADDIALEAIHQDIKQEINAGVKKVFDEPEVKANTQNELSEVFAPFQFRPAPPKSGRSKELRFVDAVKEGLEEALKAHPDLVFMGQDIATYGGVFKATEGFLEKFGEARIRNTPLCESAIFGTALGLSIQGMKSMVEMQFADFVTSGFNQVVNNLAKIHYRWGQNADVVVRMPTGAGVGAGPFHSQSNESWFCHTPGLKVFYPAFPEDAKGLLLTAFEDPNPVLFFEHKALYRSVSSEVPEGYYTIEPGKAISRSNGDQLAIITYGMGVHWALEAAQEFPENSLEIIDLRTLIPLDEASILEAVKKCNRALVLYEDTLTGGFGAEIAALISEKAFAWLDAPVKRLASLDTPVPFAGELEQNFLPKKRLKQSIQDLLNY